MSLFIPERLSVEFRNGMTDIGPILPRHYTLTHSDTSGELFLTISTQFAWDQLNKELRDEVLGVWQLHENQLTYHVFVYLDHGEHDLTNVKRRNEIFRRELPLALTAIRYGDRKLFYCYPSLDCVTITVNFISSYRAFAKQEVWGTFSNYAI